MQIQAIPQAYLQGIQNVKAGSVYRQKGAAETHQTEPKTAIDRIELSAAGREKYKSSIDSEKDAQKNQLREDHVQKEVKNTGTKQLSAEDKNAVDTLKSRDREVRIHEQAHIAAAGGYATGGARFTFEVGPDGKRYATGGEVSIDTSAIPDDPAATIRKMNTVRKAALAPMNPSAADRAIAASASSTAAKARGEMANENGEESATQTSKSTIGEPGENRAVENNLFQLKSGISAYETGVSIP
ncbi:MAG: hypothetical protein DWQ05_13670 [Calditrichaeota bacterium]|nr:MAG: hypothetical protein DWQ05_13670 [Calditrichota bacterium]